MYKKSTMSSCGDDKMGQLGRNICEFGKILSSAPLNVLLLHVRIWPVGLHIANGKGKVCLCPLVGFRILLYALDKSRVA